MPRLRVQGLVKLADRARRELAGGVSGSQLRHLAWAVASSLDSIRKLLDEHKLSPRSLSPASRRAHEFLSGLKLNGADSASAHGPHEPKNPVPEQGELIPSSPGPVPARPATTAASRVRFVRLRGHLTAILDELDAAERGPQPEARWGDIRAAIARTSQGLEELVIREGFSAEQISTESREVRGWMACFARPERFEQYVAALRRARPVLEAQLATTGRFRRPMVIHFRPLSGLFRIQWAREGTRVLMPSPMISFSAEGFAELAKWVTGQPRLKPAVMRRVMDEPYQSVLAELEARGGTLQPARGLCRDLAAAFERVNAAFFGGQMPRPKLVWSRAFTARKFGHYDHVHDTVMLSATLDDAGVSERTLDFVMYHELLHKQHGLRFRGARQSAHHADFRGDERIFPGYDEVQAELGRLARR